MFYPFQLKKIGSVYNWCSILSIKYTIGAIRPLIKFKTKMDLFNSIRPELISVFSFIGTYCLILAFQKHYEIRRVLKYGKCTIGTVIEIRQDPTGKPGQAPVVDFDYPNGTYRHFSTTYNNPSHYYVGQKVQIWYKFYKSNQIVALAHDKPGKLPKVLFICGIIFCLFSYPEIIKRLPALF